MGVQDVSLHFESSGVIQSAAGRNEEAKLPSRANSSPAPVRIDITTGQSTVLGPIWSDPTCDDLGATWVDVPCLQP